jgi:Outer membrane lipoprotein-sorting protein
MDATSLNPAAARTAGNTADRTAGCSAGYSVVRTAGYSAARSPRPARPAPRRAWRTVTLALLLAVPLAWLPAPHAARADDAQARGIMEKVNKRDDGDNQTADMRMELIDSRNNRRVREMHSFRKDKGEDTLTIMFFESPADVKGTGFLTYDYAAPGKDDDQWLYLPALRKSKRIASSDKSGSFMGSDFNYSDMTKPDLDDYDFTLVKEDEVDGHKTWQIQSVPRQEAKKEETGYDKALIWVRQDNYVVVRGIRWVHASSRLKYMNVAKLEQIDGIWIATELQMWTKEGKNTVHATVLQFNNVRFNQKLDESMFTVRQLEKGL